MEQRENIHPSVARVPTRNGAKREEKTQGRMLELVYLI
jgi:hypothetical protein